MEALVHRPIGDLLEEILDRGPEGLPAYVRYYRAAPGSFRLAVLLGALCLGEAGEEEIRQQLTRRDSAEKSAFLIGLGDMGHPLAEGYLARLVRERSSEEAAAAALVGLGRIRSGKSLPLIAKALDNPNLAQPAAEALACHGDAEARRILLERAGNLAAFRALATLGVPEAREALVAALDEGEPWDVEAVRGIGRLGDPSLGEYLMPLLDSDRPDLARAAFEAYARLGVPGGPEPLLFRAEKKLEPWMVQALGRVDHAEVHRFLLDQLEPPRAKGFLSRLFRRRARGGPAVPTLYRALRSAREPQVIERLAARLRLEEEPLPVRELLANRCLAEDPRYSSEVLAVWRRGGLLPAYLAARTLMQMPGVEFLSEALDWLGRGGFVPLDGAPPGADPERMLEAHARDVNPCLLLGGFLDTGLVNLTRLEEGLRSRFADRAFPSGAPPDKRFSGPEEQGIAEFLSALVGANPGKAEALSRLFSLLAEQEDRGDPLLDLFLSWDGSHRGGVQRALVQGFPGALGRFVQGKTDRALPELDAVADHAPREGPLARVLDEPLERARRALKAECRDMVLLLEGSQRGDMVLMEAL